MTLPDVRDGRRTRGARSAPLPGPAPLVCSLFYPIRDCARRSSSAERWARETLQPGGDGRRGETPAAPGYPPGRTPLNRPTRHGCRGWLVVSALRPRELSRRRARGAAAQAARRGEAAPRLGTARRAGAARRPTPAPGAVTDPPAASPGPGSAPPGPASSCWASAVRPIPRPGGAARPAAAWGAQGRGSSRPAARGPGPPDRAGSCSARAAAAPNGHGDAGARL
jgi:hypothetical protein